MNQKRLSMAVLAAGLLVALLPGVAVAGGGGHDRAGGPNQGNPKMVLTIDNESVVCEAVPGAKVEDGDLGRFEKILSSYQIDKVTVKSGKKAKVVWSVFGQEGDQYFVKFKLSKDISNYVVWTCPNGNSL